MAGTVAVLRIGALAQRTGVSPELLRAWERRYRLLRPVRSSGGFRLYGPGDESRVLRMKELIRDGVGAAQAARIAAGTSRDPLPLSSSALDAAARRFDRALRSYEERAIHAEIDGLIASLGLERALEVAIFPALSRVGEGWAQGEITVAQEHVAANAIRARLLAEARGWERGPGPRALLACAPGEQHELGLIAFGAVLHRRGWRIAYLGQDTPIEDVEAAAQAVDPALVVVFAIDSRLLDKVRRKITRAAKAFPLAVAGAGATSSFAHRVGARILSGGPVRAALEIAAGRRQPGDPARR